MAATVSPRKTTSHVCHFKYMVDTPPLFLLLLWILWLGQAVVCATQVYRFLRKLNRKIRLKFATYRPRAWIIVPVKGLDDDLEGHIEALCKQSYEDYKVVAVVESKQDPAYPVLQQELARYPSRESRIVVAGVTYGGMSQKVHNQLAVLNILDDECADEEVWVFADTDAVPGPDWLAMMVGPLQQRKKTGMTTGYRWLIPDAAGPTRTSMWSYFASTCNSSVACQLGPYRFNQAWGGSMAIHVEIARRGKLRERLQGSVTDDYRLTRMCRDLNLRVVFVPRCLVATPIAFDQARFFNFAFRQYLITRVYAPSLYVLALVFTSLYVMACSSALFYVLRGLGQLQPIGQWCFPLVIATMVFAANQIRSSLRSRVIERAFGREMRQQMGRTLFVDRWLTGVWMTVHWVVVIRAGFGRTISWRGIRYRLESRDRLQRLPSAK